MFKFNIKPKQIDELEAKVRRDVKEILAAPAVLNEVGQTVVERLKFQARTEQPFNQSKVLPPLKPLTIRHREYLARYNLTHPTFESARSNLTITGAFQDSLTYTILGEGLIGLYFEGNHPGYMGKSGKIKSKAVANQDLFKWLSKKGFKLFDGSIQQNKTLRSRVRTIVLRYIRRGLKIRN